MSRLSSAAVTVLSRSLVCLLVLCTAETALAQGLTVNGSSGAIEINRGDTITVGAGSGSTVRDWVGLYTAGAANGSYID